MLSQEIYDSWNAKNKEDLQLLLDNIQGPEVPKGVKSSAFKKTVLQKIEKRRTIDARRFASSIDVDTFEDFPRKPCTCSCPCRCIFPNSSRKLKYYECKTLASFDKLCVAGIQAFSKHIACTKALIQRLSYWESVKSGTDGLSVIGGELWLLSFACQHLIDSPSTKDQYSMQSHMADIKEAYQVLGQAGEMFLEISQTFHNETHMIRADALLILKKLAKKWALSSKNNPLQVRPEIGKPIPRPRKRLGAGLDSSVDVEEDDDVFSVKWTPLTVSIQLSSSEKPRAFGKLHPQDRTRIFQAFMNRVLDQVEVAAEDLTHVVHQISAVEVESDLKLAGRQITLSMVGFSKSSVAPKTLSPEERERMTLILNEFWYSVDVLHENVHVLMRLVQETRDIIRTCYVYADIFYKWHMPSYDAFSLKKNHSVHFNRDILGKLDKRKSTGTLRT